MAKTRKTGLVHPARWNRGRRTNVLGVAMIVKNEAENLPPLFESLREVADEVVVVDTGSTDGTRAVCRAWGVTLLSDPWRNDFSRPRNRGISASSAQFLLWLDADHRLPARTQREMIRLREEVLPGAGRRVFYLKIHNVDADGNLRNRFPEPRLIPRLPGVCFRNTIHEEVMTSLDALGVERVDTDLVVTHIGYASAEVLRAKEARNEEMLRREIRERGPTAHNLVQLAIQVGAGAKPQEADELVTRAIEMEEAVPEPRKRLLAEMYALRAGFALRRGGHRAAQVDLDRARTLWPEWVVVHAGLAEAKARERDWAGAMEMVERARSADLRVGDLGLGGMRVRSNLSRVEGYVLRQTGQRAHGLNCLREAVEADPFNVAAVLDYGQALLEEERYQEARDVLEPLGRMDEAASRFVDVAAGVGLARLMSGDVDGGAACLGNLLDVFAEELDGARDVSPMELFEVLMKGGYATAARNVLVFHQNTVHLG